MNLKKAANHNGHDEQREASLKRDNGRNERQGL